MGKTEPDTEVLELAISREAAAHDFYTALSKRVQDPQMKNALESFAAEELEHKARLELELMKLGVVVNTSAVAPRDDEEAIEPTMNMEYKDLLVIAMRKEKRSLRLYIDLAAVAKDRDTREMLLTLAEEEAMHHARFEVEYNILMRKQPG
ncbi:MAG: ferritin family protein [Sedimentisphaerales bacterium]|nr:ferritin family protein [Sedimentisphaerales bacterium]